MHDLEVREALHRKILAKYHRNPDTLVLDELGLLHGATRIDIAVINSLIHGYEIKSDFDTLTRLPEQARIYNATLDKITLVVGERHLAQIDNHIPDWWGVMIAREKSFSSVKFQLLRKPTLNKNIDPLSVARLLWRDEAFCLLDELGISNGLKSKPRDLLYANLVKKLTVSQLRRYVRSYLKRRSSWRAA